MFAQAVLLKQFIITEVSFILILLYCSKTMKSLRSITITDQFEVSECVGEASLIRDSRINNNKKAINRSSSRYSKLF